jgi:hypothetical protein
MAKVVIPVQAALTRTDGTTLQLSDLKSIDVQLSLDGGANFTKLPSLAPDATSITIDGVDAGSNGIVLATETDAQTPPRTSGAASVSFSVPLPALAAPNAPTLGTPVIS